MTMTSKHQMDSPDKGWKPVDLDDNFLFGLEEPGFQSLETIDAADIIDVAPELQAFLTKVDTDTSAKKYVPE
jgi:hypothetical protein